MSKKFVCIMCAMVLSSTALFTGCDLFKLQENTSSEETSSVAKSKAPLGNDSEDEEDSEESAVEEEESSEENESEDEKEEDSDEESEKESASSKKSSSGNPASSASLSAETVKSYKASDLSDVRYLNCGFDGLYYSNKDGLYGVINSEDGTIGKAIYTDLSTLTWYGNDSESQEKGYYQVTTTTNAEFDSLSEANCFGIIDSKGNKITDEKYAFIEMLNDHYAYVVTATDYTDNEDEALLYTGSAFSFGPTEDSEFIKGKWEIIDLEKKKAVTNLGSSKPSDVNAYGATIKVNDSYYSADGKEIEAMEVLDNGAYTLEKGDTVTLMSSDGKKLFDFDGTDKSVSEFDATHYLLFDGTSYVIVDEAGKVVSSELEDRPSSVGKDFSFIKTYSSGRYTICDFEGNPLIDSKFDYCNLSDDGNYVRLEHPENSSSSAGTEFIYLDKEGNIVAQFTEDDDASGYDNLGLSYISNDGKYTVCNLSTGEYSIKSKEYPDKAVMFTFFDGSNLISTLDGKPVVSTDFDNFASSAVSGYAMGISEDGTGELIKVSSKN